MHSEVTNMVKRTYLKGSDARKINRVVRLSKAEAGRLASVADAVGKSDSELARDVLLAVLSRFESTGAIELGGEVINLQPALFGGMASMTQSREVVHAT
jgi:hypothetical protein